MKRVIVLLLIMLFAYPVFAQAVTVFITSTIQVNNAPANSVLNVRCGTQSGIYTITKQFYMGMKRISAMHLE